MRTAMKPGDNDCIVRWIYTRDEWRCFAKWHAKEKGVFSYLWHFIFHQKDPIRAVEFTDKTVQIGKKRKVFRSPELTLRRVDIDEKGKMNIMNITSELANPNKQVKEIRLPIPRGKLKEAMGVQERLMSNV